MWLLLDLSRMMWKGCCEKGWQEGKEAYKKALVREQAEVQHAKRYKVLLNDITYYIYITIY